MTEASVSLLIKQARAALDEQRNALVSGDATAVLAAGETLSKVLDRLRNAGSNVPREEHAELQQAATALLVNSALLGRLSASNQRALTTLFEPAATYGLPGQSGLAAPSRTLRSA